MRRPTDEPNDAIRLLRADLYAHCLTYLMHKIDELHQSSRSIMDLDRAQLFHFVHDTNSAHGVFGDVKGSSCKTIRVIAQLGNEHKLNPYFSLTASGKYGVRTSPESPIQFTAQCFLRYQVNASQLKEPSSLSPFQAPSTYQTNTRNCLSISSAWQT